MEIPLSGPDITDLEIGYVDSVLRSRSLSLGPMLGRFESAFAEYMGCRHAIAVNSGTSGLHLIVRGLEIGEGDVVITTPFSFIASANCILFEKAKPLFVDIDRKTYNIDCAGIEEALEKMGRSASKVKGILVVHCFGMPCDLDAIGVVAEKYRLKVIEDACEAIGTMYGGRKVGGIGDAGCFGFYPNKQMTTGEGGMVVTNDEDLARACRSMRNQGRGEGNAWLEHERIGFNYRLSDINCALGLGQLERIDEILERRQWVATEYGNRLRDLEEIIPPFSGYAERVSWFVYVVRLSDKHGRSDRDRILREMRARGIGCSNYFAPIHLQPPYVKMFGHKEGDFPVTEHVSDRTIALPFFNKLTEREVKVVVDTLKDVLKQGVSRG